MALPGELAQGHTEGIPGQRNAPGPRCEKGTILGQIPCHRPETAGTAFSRRAGQVSER
jgi:hypothetical protein